MLKHDQQAAAVTALPPLPELSGKLRDYAFPKRVDVLRRHDMAKFIATSHAEVNDAFASLLDYDTTGTTTDGRMQGIAERAVRTAPRGDNDRPARVIHRVANNRAAYLLDANRDRRWLAFMRLGLKEWQRTGERYDSLAEYVGSRGMAPYEGPGQVTRYLEAAAFVLGDPISDGRFTFGATLSKNSSGQSIVIDEFTAKNPTPAMAELQRSVLSGVSMNVALAITGYTWRNSVSRQVFWERDLNYASHNKLANDVAVSALHRVS